MCHDKPPPVRVVTDAGELMQPDTGAVTVLFGRRRRPAMRCALVVVHEVTRITPSGGFSIPIPTILPPRISLTPDTFEQPLHNIESGSDDMTTSGSHPVSRSTAAVRPPGSGNRGSGSAAGRLAVLAVLCAVALLAPALLVSSSMIQAQDAADTTPPEVLDYSPADQATGVAVTTTVSVTFSEAIEPNSMLFGLHGPANVEMPVDVKYDAATWTAVLTPREPLAAGTRYAPLMTWARDLAGNRMAKEVEWSFTTAGSSGGQRAATGDTAPAGAADPDPARPTARVEQAIVLTLDRGEGATYIIGEVITPCVTVARPARVRIMMISSGPVQVFADTFVEGRLCAPQFTTAQQTGMRSIVAEAFEDGAVIASAQVSFELIDPFFVLAPPGGEDLN